ncbi:MULTISPECIES: hypothetical protein [unclassified Burkholderia]|uniref:hypothetical protein n=1 Tax=unclassified Burkholderia TaxID=2613784 RepID=UPI000F5642B4|nr:MULTISPECIES: hypothetical protein [unclassified Burkholderia]
MVLSGATPEVPPSDAQQSQVAAPAAVEAPHTGEQTDLTPPADGAGVGGAAAPTDAPPASEPGQMVPLKALEEERKGRQDWKEKAIRFEEELKHLRAQGQQPPQQQQQPVSLTYEQGLLNERMNMSEMMVRQQHGDSDVDSALEIFQKAVQENPALGAQLAQQRHPWQFMFDQAKRIQAMQEIGSDPAAYRQKLRDEILAELQQQGAAPSAPASAAPAPAAPAAPVIPRSLATARSSAPRSAPVWTGPTSLNDILKTR